jgi:hypothetical protein
MSNRAHRKNRRRVPPVDVVLAAAALLVIVVPGLLIGSRLADDNGPVDSNDAYGVDHVHGLGINPADSSLIVATHNGSFRLPAEGDEVERLGDSLQDTMGFTVVGPDQFLGSGHPDMAGRRAGQPAQLGLIESNDAGATWTELSLGGQVDFHALTHAHDQVYGWDSGTGRFMVSTNRREWETRSSLDLYSFSVDPNDADHVIAVGPDGLVDSTDGGRTWTPTSGPPVVAVSWDPTAGLWGVDAVGAIYRKGRSGWASTGDLPGEPQALLATPEALYAAAHDDTGRTGIYRSTDNGNSWDLRYQDKAS